MTENQFRDSLDALMAGEGMMPPAPIDSSEAVTRPVPVTSMATCGSNNNLMATTAAPFVDTKTAFQHPAAEGSDYGTTLSMLGLSSMGNFSTGYPSLMTPGIPPPGGGDGGAGLMAFGQQFGSSSTCSSVSGSKRRRNHPEVSEDETSERKRQDRNVREQQRSQQISCQIAHLRDILTQASVQFKPDKYSTLVTVGDYLKQLQERSRALDEEKKKLLDTVKQTSELTSSHHGPSLDGDGKSPPLAAEVSSSGSEEMGFVSGLDYKMTFASCPVPCAITSIDGRFLDCNKEFEKLTCFTKFELVPLKSPSPPPSSSSTSESTNGRGTTPSRNMSLFNVLTRDHMEPVFIAMTELLKSPQPDCKTTQEKEIDPDEDSWSGSVNLSKNDKLKVTLRIQLVRGMQGKPKFFNTTLLRTAGS